MFRQRGGKVQIREEIVKLPRWTRRRSLGLVPMLALLANLPLASAQVPCSYEVAHVIQGPPCWSGNPAPTGAYCISPNGRYVGGTYVCTNSSHTFVFDTQIGQMLLIPKPPGVTAALPRDVSNAGIVVGSATRYATYPTNDYDWGFIYDLSTGVWTDIVPLNPVPCGALVCGESTVNAINETGQCCGWRTIGTPGGTQLFPATGFIYDIASATITDIGMLYGESTGCSDINDQGTFTGSVWVNGILHSYIYQKGRAADLGSLNQWGEAVSWAINQNDVVVGSSVVKTPKFPLENPTAFQWSA